MKNNSPTLLVFSEQGTALVISISSRLQTDTAADSNVQSTSSAALATPDATACGTVSKGWNYCRRITRFRNRERNSTAN